MSRWKDLYTASYICVELLSVLFYPNYSLLLCFVKINIYHQSKYIILQYKTRNDNETQSTNEHVFAVESQVFGRTIVELRQCVFNVQNV